MGKKLEQTNYCRDQNNQKNNTKSKIVKDKKYYINIKLTKMHTAEKKKRLINKYK